MVYFLLEWLDIVADTGLDWAHKGARAARSPAARPLSGSTGPTTYTTYCYDCLDPLFHEKFIHASAFTIN